MEQSATFTLKTRHSKPGLLIFNFLIVPILSCKTVGKRSIAVKLFFELQTTQVS